MITIDASAASARAQPNIALFRSVRFVSLVLGSFYRVSFSLFLRRHISLFVLIYEDKTLAKLVKLTIELGVMFECFHCRRFHLCCFNLIAQFQRCK